MLTRIGAALLIVLCLCASREAPGAEEVPADDLSWVRGVNYVPSYARNDVQIWMDYDPEVIDRELGYAARLRLNSVRIFLQYLVYEHDPEQFLKRWESFLGLCEKHGIRAMPVVFDSCFGELPDLNTYREDDWVANPGQDRLGPEHRPALERYVRDVVARHRHDKRILLWDVMNEPMCTSHAKTEEGRKKIWKFLDHFLDVVNEVDPHHPTTVGFMSSQFTARVIDKVDVLGFHNYTGDMHALGSDIRHVKALGTECGKPVIINEIARRNTGQHFWLFMPLLEEERIGWCFWELMLGNTQFSRGEDPIQGVIYPDGTCRDSREIAAIVGVWPRSDEPQQGVAPGPGQVNDTDQAGFVRYSDGWTLWTGSGPRGGTLHYASQADCTAELTFYGTQVDVIHKVGPDCGVAEILVDGPPAAASELDTYSGAVEWNRRTLVARKLPAGRHTVAIRVAGRKHAESSNTYVQIVGFDVR